MWEPPDRGARRRRAARRSPPTSTRSATRRGPAPATFENSLERFAELDRARSASARVALVVHDWGGFIGLAWACDHPDRVAALVISDTGFFADGKWHGMAEALRSEQGEALVGGARARRLRRAAQRRRRRSSTTPTIDAYWAPFADSGRGQRATLEFYRSMDFEKLEPWQGKLAELGVPTLLLWGADDPFAPLAGATPLRARDPGRPPGRDRGRRALRLSTSSRSAASPRSPAFSPSELTVHDLSPTYARWGPLPRNPSWRGPTRSTLPRSGSGRRCPPPTSAPEPGRRTG